jgi:nicotinamidase-related amidase
MSQQPAAPLSVDPAQAALVLIDVQPSFLDSMAGTREPIMARLEHLLMLADHYDLPTLATFEHPIERKGWLPERLEPVFPEHGQSFVKHTYNLCREPEIRAALEALDARQLIVAGTETDVCVLHSVLGLLELGYQIFLLEDCVFSSEPHCGPALRRMYQAGVIPSSYKTLHFELKVTVDVGALHETWNQRQGEAGPRFVHPKDLPYWEPDL